MFLKIVTVKCPKFYVKLIFVSDLVTMNDTIANCDQECKSMIYDYLIRNGFTKVAKTLHELHGPFAKKSNIQLEIFCKSQVLKRKRFEEIATTDLVYDYLQRNGHEKIARKYRKLTEKSNAERKIRENDPSPITLEHIFNTEYVKTLKPKSQQISSKIGEKFMFNAYIEEEKNYDELVLVSKAYTHRFKFFSPRPNSEMDKAIAHLLRKELKVPFISLKVSSNTFKRKETQNIFPKIRIGRFTKVQGGEKETLENSWNLFIENAQISNPTKFHEELQSNIKVREVSHNEKWKLILIGAFLSQKLPYLRHPMDVMNYVVNQIFSKFDSGAFSPEEDTIILEEIDKCNGNIEEAILKLATILKRTKKAIRYRIPILLDKGIGKQGHWTLAENQILINYLFPDKSMKTIEYVTNLGFDKIRASGVAPILNRLITNVHRHWQSYLKGLLLRHHYGVLHKSWKPLFLQYLIDNKIAAVQDVDYNEVGKICPGVVSGQVDAFFQGLKGRSQDEKNLPIYKIAKRYVKKYKDRADCRPKERELREAIVHHYDINRS